MPVKIRNIFREENVAAHRRERFAALVFLPIAQGKAFSARWAGCRGRRGPAKIISLADDEVQTKWFRQAQPAKSIAPFYFGFTNFKVIRSLSPIAKYFSLSCSFNLNEGGSVHTPSG
jgi:hypothetical protein